MATTTIFTVINQQKMLVSVECDDEAMRARLRDWVIKFLCTYGEGLTALEVKEG